jgi:hypothetical protein
MLNAESIIITKHICIRICQTCILFVNTTFDRLHVLTNIMAVKCPPIGMVQSMSDYQYSLKHKHTTTIQGPNGLI